MMTLITMDASELKDMTSAADQPIAQSPVAWFVTRYGALPSQHPNIETKRRKEIIGVLLWWRFKLLWIFWILWWIKQQWLWLH